jgi:hypothetical protein
MAASDDFKKALRAGNLTEAFAIAIGQAVELKISTRIAQTEPSFSSMGDLRRTSPDSSLQTRLNLVEGKIENKIGDRFINGDTTYQEVREFHLEQVAQGHQTIDSNLQSLQKMFRLMTTFEQQRLGKSPQSSQWLQLDDGDGNLEWESQTSSTARSNSNPNSDDRNALSDRSYFPTNGVSEFAASNRDRTANGYVRDRTGAVNFDDDEEAIILSLEDLDPEMEDERNDDDEEWGDWMVEETNADESIQTIDLRPIDFKQDDEDWKKEN